VYAAVALSIFTAGAAAEPPQASVQQSAATSGDAELETVIVEARRQRALLKRQVNTFVSQITTPSRTESLARWERPLCPFVAGFPLEHGEHVVRRVSQIASEAGMKMASPDCSPNLLMVMTPEPELFLQMWWRKNPRLFDRERGVGAIKHTIRTAAPVRVFYNACSTVPPAKAFALRVMLDCDANVLSGSRLAWSAVRAIYSVIVVVDLRQTKNLNIEPLADYIAMVSLAQVRREPEFGTAPTVLRLFEESNAGRPPALSTWDQAFLKSLYGSDSASVLQLSQIKFRMAEELTQ
jgi:hypothetical protein